MDKKTRAKVEPLFRKLQQESRKYRDLKSKKAFAFAIWRQKLVVKSARKNIDSAISESKKQFESILTPAQKAKFEVIDAKKKKQMEEFRKSHRPGKHKMGPKPPKGIAPPHMAPPEGGRPEGAHAPELMGPPPPPPKEVK